jgi:multiple sugar transport system ATP-binding protein
MRGEISRLQRDVGVTTIYVTHDQVEAMTMGDRVAVMRLGVLQQVDAPSDLYRKPVNLFVAGFIGSPAMNIVEATIDTVGDRLFATFGSFRLPIEDATLQTRPALRSYAGRTVILGIRPEDMEDAGLASGSPEEHRMKTTVELREDMGSEILVHFTIDSPPVITDDTRELAEDRGIKVEELDADADRSTFIARFSANSLAQVDDVIEVLVDTRAMYFFDPDTGVSIRDEVPAAAYA